MYKFDIYDLLSRGAFLDLWVNEDTSDKAISKLGQYSQKTKDSKDFYTLYWENISITFYSDDHKIFYIEILFDEDDIQYSGYKIDEYYGEISFDKQLELQKLFLYLNFQKIPYEIKTSLYDPEYLIVRINSTMNLEYYLPDKTLNRITINDNPTPENRTKSKKILKN